MDREALASKIRRILQRRGQVSLAEVASAYPLQHGLAELVAYLGLAAEDPAAVIEEHSRETITWENEEGQQRLASVPLVIFTRSVALAADLRGS